MEPSGQNAPTAVDGIYKSITDGQTWTKLNVTNANGDPPIVPTDMEYTIVGNQFVLYAGLGNVLAYSNYADNTDGIWKSVDGGRSWTVAFQVPVGNTAIGAASGLASGRISLAADHTPGYNPLVYAAFATPQQNSLSNLSQVIRSPDNGQTWTAIVNASTRIGPANGQGVLIAGQGGVFGNQSAAYYLALAVDPRHPNIVYLGGLRPFQGSIAANGVITWTAIAPTNNIPHNDQHAWAFTASQNNDGSP